ncbi:MAG: extracellular solute-binding protein [Candidatus Bathyarchaeia archaeon]
MTSNKALKTDRRTYTKSLAAIGLGAALAIGGGSYYYYSTRKGRGAAETEKPSTLRVRAWGGGWAEGLKEGVIEPFTEKYGIKVELDYTEDNVLQAKLREIIPAGGEPPVDVNWTTTTNAMREALWGFASPIMEEDLTHLDELHEAAYPERIEGIEGLPFINVYSYTYSLAYDTEKVPEKPKSWRILWEPEYRRSVAMYDDGIGFFAVLAKLSGAKIPDDMEPAWKLLRELKPNIAFVGEDPDLTQGFVERQVALECTIPTNALEAKRAGAPVAWTVPEEGVTMENDAMYVPRNLPRNRDYWAKKFIDMAISPEGQSKWCEYLGCPPVNRNAEIPEYMEDDPAFPTSKEDYEKMLIIPYRILVEHEKDWFAKFEEIMG